MLLSSLRPLTTHLRALRIHDRSNPTVMLIAKRIIDLARRGQRDPDVLQDAVLKSFRDDRGVSSM